MTETFFSISRSLCRAPGARRYFALASTVLALACGREGRTNGGTGDSASNPATLVARLREYGARPVESVDISAHRTSVTLVDLGVPVSPDSEQIALAAFAERIWDDTLLGVRSETITVAVVRSLGPPGSMERSTYYFYRSHRKK